MLRRSAAAVFALVLTAALPAAAEARPRAQMLVDEPPLRASFKDAVVQSSPAIKARASASTVQFNAFPTQEGYSVAAAISPRYANPDPAIARSYIDFLDSLPHSSELAKLAVYIAPADEVLAACGGAEGTLACYDSRSHIMVVPGEQTADSTGVTTSYVVAHEYGHHIAAFRSNAPFSAFTMGPKYWSSYEMNCNKATKGLLFPGNEAENYSKNPGEGWAETYAHMKYPDQKWIFDPIMQPDQGAFAAAARDIGEPWTRNRTKVFTGTFGARGSNSRRYVLTLTLDGSLSLRLKGPRDSNYNMVITSDGGGSGRTTAPGSRDRLAYKAVCRSLPAEHITLTVKRVKGSGPFSVRVSYAG
jgi:hypothetical protein